MTMSCGVRTVRAASTERWLGRVGRNRLRRPEQREGRSIETAGHAKGRDTFVAAQAGPAGLEPATPGFGDPPGCAW